jgi:hypothetical protein
LEVLVMDLRLLAGEGDKKLAGMMGTGLFLFGKKKVPRVQVLETIPALVSKCWLQISGHG